MEELSLDGGLQGECGGRRSARQSHVCMCGDTPRESPV